MTKFHITSSGKPAACKAKKKACPLGGEHFDSEAEARQGIEKIFGDSWATKPARKSKAVAESVEAYQAIHSFSRRTGVALPNLSQSRMRPEGSWTVGDAVVVEGRAAIRVSANSALKDAGSWKYRQQLLTDADIDAMVKDGEVSEMWLQAR